MNVTRFIEHRRYLTGNLQSYKPFIILGVVGYIDNKLTCAKEAIRDLRTFI